MKCRMSGILKANGQQSFEESIKLEKLGDIEKKILEERFKRMFNTLMSVNGNLSYGNSESEYLCNNFFNLVNDTLNNTNTIKVQETIETTVIEKVKTNEIFTINHLINPLNYSQIINNYIGNHNIFGMNINRQSPDLEIENIINIINKYKGLFHDFLLEEKKISKKEIRDITIKMFLDVLIDRSTVYTINEIFEKLIDDPKFIKTIRSNNSITRYINQGGVRKTLKRPRKRKKKKNFKKSRKNKKKKEGKPLK